MDRPGEGEIQFDAKRHSLGSIGEKAEPLAQINVLLHGQWLTHVATAASYHAQLIFSIAGPYGMSYDGMCVWT